MKASQVSKVFGKVLRDQRLAMDLSQEALALASDVDRTFVSQMERGIRQPTLTTLFKLSGALNITVTKMVSRAEKALLR